MSLRYYAINMQINKHKLIFAEALLEEHFPRIRDWAIGDIRKCCRIKPDGTYKRGAGALIGAFILWCCAIEYFGGLLTGVRNIKDKKTGKIQKDVHTSKFRIGAFVRKYLIKYAKYNPNKIYKLRNSLLHSYTPAGYEVLEHDLNKRQFQLKKTNKGCLLHLGSAIEDLEKSVSDYEKDLMQKSQLKLKAYEYYQLNPMIKPLRPEELVILNEDCD